MGALIVLWKNYLSSTIGFSDESVDLDTIIQKYRLAIEKAIKETELIHGSPLSKEAKLVMEAGGKRLRPVLVLMGCEAVSGQFETAIPAALAYELAHEASLVQDDIFDNSDTET